MHVVRHDAIRVDKKRANRRVFSQAGDEPRGKAWIYREALTIVEAERDKVQITPAIAAGRKPEIFALELGTYCHKSRQGSVPR
jgi:hypothetical protein